jgi:1-acyl-sn-glycerol-3-phosphate acyltransferase
MYRAINFIIRVYTRITCRLDMPGLDKFPARGPLIAIANHTGQLEVPLIFAHLQPRELTGWAKVESWDNWFLRWVFGVWKIIPIRRGEADMHALKAALRALDKGMIFGLAPEGTRNYNGILKRALPGAVIVALHSGAPIIPIAHWGGENFLKNLKQFKRTDYHVRIGEPFKINVEGVRVTGEVRQQIVDEMMIQLAKLLPEYYRGYYADTSKWTEQYIAKLERGL